MSKISLPLKIFIVFISVLVLALIVYNIPFVHEKLSWRIDEIRTQIIYFFRPPEQAVFVPEQQAQINQMVTATLEAMLNAKATTTPTIIPTAVGPTSTPTITPAPLPSTSSVSNITYVDQHGRWNYCGPANITMALNFWGWKGNRDDVAKIIKPGLNDPKVEFIERGKTDKNVMPYEMIDFVNDNTEFRALQRFGGDSNLLKRLISAGYPVLIEKGYYERDYMGKITWMGHYLFVTGYDDIQGGFTVQDAWLVPGKNLLSKYDIFEQGWRDFNYLFMVVYPTNQEKQVYDLLGDWADQQWANRNALTLANSEIKTLKDIDLFFAWFNKGTSHVQLLEYVDAANAFDQAFNIYATLGQDEKQRPYHMMWYQTWPYKAYFYTGRYQDVIDLANTTLLKTIDKPTLEESLFWRGMAQQAIGNTTGAIDDFKTANHLNPRMAAIIQALQSLGISPETPTK